MTTRMEAAHRSRPWRPRLCRALAAVVGALSPALPFAQVPVDASTASPSVVLSPAKPDAPIEPAGTSTESGAASVRLRNWAIVGGGALAVGLYGKRKWWSDGFTGRFRTVDEGWFDQGTPSGGVDKLGHVYANYVGTRLLARAFEWVGNDSDDSLKLAAWSTLGTFTAVEVIDGYSKKWRFSKEDAVMNLAGAGLGVLLEKNPGIDRLIDFRLLYRPSTDASGRRRDYDPFGDYSGQRYLLVAKASGVPALRKHWLLRYFELAIGYGARGFEEIAPGVTGERSRHAYYGVSLNLAELLGQTVFRGAAEPARTQRAANLFFELVQVPGTAALADHRF